MGTPHRPHFFQKAHGTKAIMLRGIGLADWLLDLDANQPAAIVQTLMDIHEDYPAAETKVSKAMALVRQKQRETVQAVSMAAV